MKQLSSFGAVFDVSEKRIGKRTMFTAKWRGCEIEITRYSRGAYYFKDNDGKLSRIRIRKWFPDWWWRV